MATDINEPLSYCSADTPMGRLLREYWIPALPSSALVADGAPYRLRLLGEPLVAFRDSNGDVGVLDETCPHRGASLVLGRNEECGLRCLYHGWKMDVHGNVVDTPREVDPNYGRRIPPSGYPVVEQCGIIWTYLGAQRPAPPLPDYPFSVLPDDHVGTLCIPMACNLVPALDAVFDPTHVPMLHQSSLNPAAKISQTLLDLPPYEEFAVDRLPHGARMARVAAQKDGQQLVKMMEYFFPYLRLNSQTADPDADSVAFGNVPIDDEHVMFWFILYNESQPPSQVGYPIQVRGPSGIREMPHKADTNWGQNRAAMSHHFTGLCLDEPDIALIFEDLVVQESMMPMLDRTRQHLAPSDSMVAQCRTLMRTFLHEYEQSGTFPDHSKVRSMTPRSFWMPEGSSWRDHYPPVAAAAAVS